MRSLVADMAQSSRDVERARVASAGSGCSASCGGSESRCETQVGFSGNDRYLVLGTAPVAIAGGVAWGWFAQTARAMRSGRLRRGRRACDGSPARAGPIRAVPPAALVAIALFLAMPPWIGKNVISLPRTHRALMYQAHLREDLRQR